METVQHLFYGIGVVLQPANLLLCFVGVLLGTLVGVLPGLGPASTMAILLPVIFNVNPVGAIIMLAGIYYGCQYGGSTTSILLNIPGEVSSVVTCLDGYQMARQGRAGKALGISAFGSFIGGTITVILLMLVAPPLAEFALKFGPPEYFAITILAIILLTFLSSDSMPKALCAASLGICLGTVGTDYISGTERFTFNIPVLLDGVGLVPVAMGMFGMAEVFDNVEKTIKTEVFKTSLKGLFPNLDDWKRSIGPILRATGLGFCCGVLPGAGGTLATFASYALEKKLSKHPEEFGKGAIEGVAGPETANNASSTGTFIPLFTLGIPCNIVTAILLGAMMIFGMQPGPTMIVEHPDLFWGVVASMYVGNIMLMILNLPLIGLWVQVLKVPYHLLFPIITLFCLVGAYSVNNNADEVMLMIIFGIIGYLFRKFSYPGAPFLLAIIIGPMMEKALRQSLLRSGGSGWVFFTRPISLVILLIAFALLLSAILPQINKKRQVLTD